jgi:formamidopyrimidine-DNA glycosylase
VPELPEIEIVKRSLIKMINKARIIDIKIKNKNLRYKIPNNFYNHLINEKIIKISRKSKYLILHFKTKILLIHFGMTGKFLVLKNKSKKLFKTSFYYDLNILPKHNHIHFFLSGGITLIYNDVRRFGFIKLYKNKKISDIKHISKLGLEPFSKKLNINYFKKIIKGKNVNIKVLLMDQTFICGLGNIYVNEVLFMSNINPLRKCKKLNNNEIKKIILNIKLILKIAISKGGSSIQNFNNTDGKSGSFQQLFKVYGREKNFCSSIPCKGVIKKINISNRSSFFCNKCQK